MALHKGRVQWFDDSSGEGMIVGDDNYPYYVHYSCVRGWRLGGPRVTLTEGRRVEFTVYSNLYSKCVDKCWEVENDEK